MTDGPPSTKETEKDSPVDRVRAVATSLSEKLARRTPRSPRVQRLAMPLAAVVFVAGVVVAWRQLPERSGETVQPLLLVSAAALAFCTTALNGAEYALAARFCGRSVSPLESFRISVLSSAANSLPVPGAVIVKTRALRRLGSTYRLAIQVMAAIGFVWVGIASLAAGALDARRDGGELAVALLALGVASLAIAFVLFTAQSGAGAAARRIAVTSLLEGVAVSLTATRLFLVVQGMGYDTSWAQAYALAAAAIIATAVGFFPAGLGLREVLSAGTAELAGLPAALGLVAAAVDRIILSLVLAGTALALTMTRSTGSTGGAAAHETGVPETTAH